MLEPIKYVIWELFIIHSVQKIWKLWAIIPIWEFLIATNLFDTKLKTLFYLPEVGDTHVWALQIINHIVKY